MRFALWEATLPGVYPDFLSGGRFRGALEVLCNIFLREHSYPLVVYKEFRPIAG